MDGWTAWLPDRGYFSWLIQSLIRYRVSLFIALIGLFIGKLIQ
jgi:hypothetical protein